MSAKRFAIILTLVGAAWGVSGCIAPTDPGLAEAGRTDSATAQQLAAALLQVAPSEPSAIDEAQIDPSLVQFPLFRRAPWGTWLLESGNALPSFITGQATFGQTTDVVAMILNDDGAGRVFFRDRVTGATDCARAFALFNGEMLVLDFAAEDLNAVFFDQVSFFFPVVVVDQDMLGLADEEGNVALFSRQTELPADVTCGELEVLDQFNGLPAPQSFTDLVLFNGDLVYNSGAADQIEAFDLDTDTLTAPLGPSNNRLVQTTQDGFLWTHCGCGGSRDAFKRTLLIVADTINSETEMGGVVTMRAMAYHPASDRLWIHGRVASTQSAGFFVMNTAGEPDVVDRQISFNRDVRALAFDGDDLWGVVTVASQSIVRIDPDTGKVVQSFEVPDEDVSFSGIVFDEFDMYLLGTDPLGDGVIYRIAHP